MRESGLFRTLALDLDLGILFTTFGLTGVATLYYGRLPKPTLQPFFLSDESLWHDWKDDTIPIWTVFVAGYIGVSILIYFVEFNTALYIRRTSRKRAQLTAMRFAIGVWTASMLSVCLTEWAKGYVGRLRPNFAERCLGPSLQEQISEASLLSGPVAQTVCSGSGAHDGRRSFPSGHAALASGIAAFAQLWAIRIPGIIPYLTGLLLMTVGLLVGVSRIVDGAHHVSDVVGGVILGIWFSAVHFWWVQRETALAETLDELAIDRHRE